MKSRAEFRDENPEKAKQKRHEKYIRYRERNKAYSRAYYQINKDKIKEYQRNYHADKKAVEQEFATEVDDLD